MIELKLNASQRMRLLAYEIGVGRVAPGAVVSRDSIERLKDTLPIPWIFVELKPAWEGEFRFAAVAIHAQESGDMQTWATAEKEAADV
jgi:hypothetical protein